MMLATTPQGPFGLIEIALLIFFTVFVLIVIGVLRHGRGHFDDDARIPLDDAMPDDDPLAAKGES